MVPAGMPGSLRGEVMDPRIDPAAWLESIGVPLAASYADLLAWVRERVPDTVTNVLDVGYGWGASTMLWLQTTAAKVTTVDPLDVGWYAECRPTAKLTPEQDKRWVFIQGKMEVLADQLPGPFDFIFLDADHAYDSTVAQLAACWELLAPGGIIAGHDCYSFPDDVGAAVIEFSNHWDVPVEYTDLDAGAWLITKGGELGVDNITATPQDESQATYYSEMESSGLEERASWTRSEYPVEGWTASHG